MTENDKPIVMFEFWGGSFKNMDDQDQFIRRVFHDFEIHKICEIEMCGEIHFTVKDTTDEKIDNFISTINWYIEKGKMKESHYRHYHIIKEA